MAKNAFSRKTFDAMCAASIAEGVPVIVIAEREGYDSDALNSVAASIVAADNRPHKSKPSAETVRNREIVAELAHEVNARGKEFTAADLAELYTDPDGMALSPRKIGSLLRQAAIAGLISVSPYAWQVKHYAPAGFEDWEEKPARKTRKKTETDAEPTDASDSEQSDAQDVAEDVAED